jgi:hypothetical protein
MNRDIRIDVEFWQHAKTKRMMSALGDLGPISVQRLWCYAAKHRPTGVLTGMDPDDIERAAEWPKRQKGKFFEFCLRNRWLDTTELEGVFKIHEWERYNSWAADAPSRAEYSRRAAHERHHVKKGVSKPQICDFCREINAERMRGAQLGQASRNADLHAPPPISPSAPSPSPSPTPLVHRAREAAGAWNDLSPFLNRPSVDDAAVAAIADKAETVTDEILKLRPDFTWAECINRIKPGSWLVRESRAFSFEWLFGRDRNNTQWNAVKIWDGRLGTAESEQRQFDREGDDPVFDAKGRARRVVE